MSADGSHHHDGTGVRLADSAHQQLPERSGRLDRVGMSGIELPVRLHDPATGTQLLAAARADAFVDLADADARGIHMSRLYLSLQALLAEQELDLALLGRVLASFLGSHLGLSTRASVRLSFDQLVKRPALVSANAAWRAYPVWMGAATDGVLTRFTLGAQVLYASTCPCSGALSRQALADRLREQLVREPQLGGEAIARWLEQEQAHPAIAHSQRSRAVVEIAVASSEGAPGTVELVDLAERALGTPVQAAVKREDELEFARRSASNLMFCEDACRRLAAALAGDPRLCDWRAEVAHLESLHPHDAVAAVAKGVPGGFRA